MPHSTAAHLALSVGAARQLANATKPSHNSPRSLRDGSSLMLSWVGVEAGICRVNKVWDESRVLTACSQRDERDLHETCVDDEELPREYFLSAVTSTVNIHTCVSDR